MEPQIGSIIGCISLHKLDVSEIGRRLLIAIGGLPGFGIGITRDTFKKRGTSPEAQM